MPFEMQICAVKLVLFEAIETHVVLQMCNLTTQASRLYWSICAVFPFFAKCPQWWRSL